MDLPARAGGGGSALCRAPRVGGGILPGDVAGTGPPALQPPQSLAPREPECLIELVAHLPLEEGRNHDPPGEPGALPEVNPARGRRWFTRRSRDGRTGTAARESRTSPSRRIARCRTSCFPVRRERPRNGNPGGRTRARFAASPEKISKEGATDPPDGGKCGERNGEEKGAGSARAKPGALSVGHLVGLFFVAGPRG
jgi:hypothetical protein